MAAYAVRHETMRGGGSEREKERERERERERELRSSLL